MITMVKKNQNGQNGPNSLNGQNDKKWRSSWLKNDARFLKSECVHSKKRKVGSFNQFPMSIFHHGMKALVRTHIKCARAHVKPKFHSLYHGAMEVRTEWTPNQASFQAQQVEHNNWLWRTHQPMPYVFYRTKTDAPQGRCRAHLFSLVETTHFERSSWRLWNWKTFRKNMRTKPRRKSNSGKGRNCSPLLSTWESQWPC